ncbi:IclR family transcriptional regulator domain-containing protein [Ramlibacter sp.]|uniref:IclR family transcriptional regulator domain-containing protein n=1 Tax=Ramlibacter sp. TaxID=1917967 RepID=UPI002D563231|nr:IclR family transcriptional regulator C-terminal domain-containing protein [Ramlibacter sp.]HYD74408.1 IclR family transcriptional regulator C-terminal domain-containing protein [Ramlibacter sp.]
MIARADFIEGMAKGMAVLESFDTERQRLNATLAAQRAGLTRAAARRHLLTLAHLGYLETDGSWFWLAPKVLRFSGSYLASARLPRAVQPTLDKLAVRTGEAFSVVVLDGDQVVIVARSGPTRLLAYGLHLGARLPAHATSTGRVLLAAKRRTEFAEWLKGRELPRLTANTVVELKKLRQIIDQVRQQDWCVANEEHELGVHAAAVPLRNLEGAVVGALNVVTRRERVLQPAFGREMLPLLQEGAREARPLV